VKGIAKDKHELPRLRAGRDEVLEAGVKYLEEKVKSLQVLPQLIKYLYSE
jgi:hypothetical protein